MVKMSVVAFGVVMPSGLIGDYQCFGEVYCPEEDGGDTFL
jgi:hypothetical protein